MADQNVNQAEEKGAVSSLARERLLWVLRPLGALALLLWILNPSVSAQRDIQQTALLGFLLGAGYGLLMFRKTLYYYLIDRRENQREMRNRLPDEYYWGRNEETLFTKDV